MRRRSVPVQSIMLGARRPDKDQRRFESTGAVPYQHATALPSALTRPAPPQGGFPRPAPFPPGVWAARAALSTRCPGPDERTRFRTRAIAARSSLRTWAPLQCSLPLDARRRTCVSTKALSHSGPRWLAGLASYTPSLALNPSRLLPSPALPLLFFVLAPWAILVAHSSRPPTQAPVYNPELAP